MNEISQEEQWLDMISETEKQLEFVKNQLDINETRLAEVLNKLALLQSQYRKVSNDINQVETHFSFYLRTPKFIKWVVNTFFP